MQNFVDTEFEFQSQLTNQFCRSCSKSEHVNKLRLFVQYCSSRSTSTSTIGESCKGGYPSLQDIGISNYRGNI